MMKFFGILWKWWKFGGSAMVVDKLPINRPMVVMVVVF